MQLLVDRVVLSFAPSFIEAISPACVPLPVIEDRSVHKGVAALQERVIAQVHVHRSSSERRLIVCSERGYQILCSELHVPESAIAQLARER